MTGKTRAETIWHDAIPYLIAHGEPERTARSFIGALLGKHDHGIVRQALSQCMNGERVEPKSYIRARIAQLEADVPKPINEWPNRKLLDSITFAKRWCETRQNTPMHGQLQAMREEAQRRNLL